MKKPSKNISRSLRGQKPGGRVPVNPEVSSVKMGGVSMTVPGEGMVETPPGKGMQDRSAGRYAEPMGKKFR